MRKEIIRSKRSLLDLRLSQVWEYRDLLWMFVRRDFVASYKQTILGPVWFVLQPVLTTIMFTFVFGNIAGISTDGHPKVLFYMSGLVIWNYFSDCLNKTSNVFVANANIFGKVYFPRLIMPLAIVASGLIRFFVQLALFLSIWFWFYFNGNTSIGINSIVLFLPLLILFMACFALGLGMIISSMTTKYRDLSLLVGFSITLLMYATPVIYPMNAVPNQYKMIVNLNPLTSIVETFRMAFLGKGELEPYSLIYSFTCMLGLLFIGVLVFNKVEQDFMDTV